MPKRFRKYITQLKSALPWAIGVLIVIELILRLPSVIGSGPFSEIDRCERIFEAALERSPAPKITALGSSRFQNAINPGLIEQKLGLQTGDVANLGCPAATPQDWVRTYSREREYFSQLDVLVIEVGARSFNWTLITDTAAPNLKFRRFSDISDRLETPSEHRTDFLLGYVWKLYDYRNVIKFLIDGAIRADFSHPADVITFELDGQHGKSDGEFSEVLGSEDELPVQDFRKFALSEYQSDHFTRLLKMADEDGMDVVLLAPPLNDHFESRVLDNHLDEDGLWRNRITESSGQQIVELINADPLCVIWQKCYYDYEHLNVVGAAGFSTALAENLSTRLTR